MIVGILKEIKSEENRVAMTPSGVDVMVAHKHTVLVEHNAGAGSGFSDSEYIKAGAEIVATPVEIYQRAEMVMHVKEILPPEYKLLRKDQLVFTYLHLAADKPQTEALLASGCVAVAYETVQTEDRRLPLLQPMSEIAGKMSVQEGAKYLEMPFGGLGVLLGGVPGVKPAKVVVIGGGEVGLNAAKVACGMGADVTIMDISLARLRYLADVLPANCKTLMSSPMNIRMELESADLVIGAVLVPGAAAPKLVTADMIKGMKKGAVMVDVAIDQGGCFETSHATKHSAPVYMVDGVLHYCVGNIPGAVARTSTLALTNATLPYALELADKGWEKALKGSPALFKGLNVCRGKLTYEPVGRALGMETATVEL